MAESRPPAPWEIKAATAVLVLLCLGVAREIVVYLIESPTGIYALTETGPFGKKYHGNSEYRISGSGTGVGALVFLSIYIGHMIGFRLRSPLAWWMGLILIGGAGLVNLLFLLPAFHHLFPENGQPLLAETFLDPKQRFWLVSRVALQLSVPALLILARLRGRLKDWD